LTTFARTDEGDLRIPRVLITAADQVCVQTIRDGLALWAEEWFLDQSVGYPWQNILGQKSINTGQFITLMRSYLLSCIGVAAADVTARYNGVTRAFAYTFSATLNSGAVISGGSNVPFQYKGPN
jgi:hypothetical protein